MILSSLWYRWKYRHYTEAELKAELKQCIDVIREEYKDEPADRTTHEAFESMNEIEKILELKPAEYSESPR